ncbi:hypothetical protein Taro_023190 [Colocasia esculenta]|uniref:Uncharacterized protein n=1 Tax=Colocasia esculenta TaxID=4460 RepID=A0A843VAM1_COLES|nr:hypothetical protein [Colocasia esculenta]
MSARCMPRFCFRIVCDSAGSAGVVSGPTLISLLPLSLEFLLLWLRHDLQGPWRGSGRSGCYNNSRRAQKVKWLREGGDGNGGCGALEEEKKGRLAEPGEKVEERSKVNSGDGKGLPQRLM